MRSRLTYANVAATLALVLSMSGGALAAKHYLISSTSQISPKVLKKLHGAKGKTGATGATGKQGPTGGQGPEGKQGPPAPPPTETFAAHLASVPVGAANAAEQVLHLSLPTGNYTLLATTESRNAGSSSVESGCVFRTDPATAGEEVVIFGETGSELVKPHGTRYLAMQWVLKVTAPRQELSLLCKSSSTEESYVSPTLVATKVSTLG